MAAAEPIQLLAAGAGQCTSATKPQPATADARPWSGPDTKLQPGAWRKPAGSTFQTVGWRGETIRWRRWPQALIGSRRTEMTPTIYYCYDAYCGWCYGFSPIITRLFNEY